MDDSLGEKKSKKNFESVILLTNLKTTTNLFTIDYASLWKLYQLNLFYSQLTKIWQITNQTTRILMI